MCSQYLPQIVVALFARVLISAASAENASAELLDANFGVVRIATGCEFAEGPAVGPDGSLFFSDQPNDRIMKLESRGELSEWLKPCGAANGLLFDANGDLLMCQSARENGGRAVAKYDFENQKIVSLTQTYDGKKYIAPNDLCVLPNGTVYFTDPYYDGDQSQPSSGVYALTPDGTVTRLLDDLLKPNGIALSPDKSVLYVSDRGTQKLHRYKLIDGKPVADGIVYDFSPDRGIDGMAVDVLGNIYGAAGQDETTGLFVISPDGKLLLHKPMPEFSTNVTFGGEDMRDLFLTASTSVYKMRTRIPGVAPTYSKATSVFAGPPEMVLPEGAGEGPAWNPKGGLIFSGGGGINQLTADGKVARFLDGTATNGLLFDAKGRLLRCENANGRITRVDVDGTVGILTSEFNGARYNQPNDITVDSKGRIFFSDPKYGPRTDLTQFDNEDKAVEGVYRIDNDLRVERVITHEVDRPNGVLVSKEDRYLFVADNNNNTDGGARKLYRFELADGIVDLQSKRLLFDWGTGRGPDGMAEDLQGRIYVAGGRHEAALPFETVDGHNKSGVYVFDENGQLLAFASIPRDEVTNCTFGGPDRKTLYVTAGGTLWSIRTTIAGYDSADR
ncbi:MAG: SMP-30/gluconolactonase/LRE family protein [Planctomycetales bacterium]|nr:SMP-30/gluconolactonase/LRE family protein [Planctomycetales bacterium]